MINLEQIGAPAFAVKVLPDERFRYLGVNRCHEAWTGLKNELLRGRSPEDCFPPEMATRLNSRYRDCMTSRSLVEYEVAYDLPAGSMVWRTSLTPLLNKKGVVTTLVGLSQDVTKTKRLERELQVSNQHLTLVLQALKGADWRFIPETGEFITSPNFALLMGEEAPRPVPWQEWCGRVLLEDIGGASCDRLLAREVEGEVVRFRFRGRDNDIRWAQCRRAIVKVEGIRESISGVIVDITEERRREMRLEQEAMLDPLTGLMNRRGFDGRMGQITPKRGSEDWLTMLALDLDGFKRLNDRLGHATGDEVLVEVARRLKTTLGKAAVCARLGGDEFVVALPGVGPDRALAIKEELSTILGRPFLKGDEVLPMAASVGQACAMHPLDPVRLLAEADTQLYEEKRRRRRQRRSRASLPIASAA